MQTKTSIPKPYANYRMDPLLELPTSLINAVNWSFKDALTGWTYHRENIKAIHPHLIHLHMIQYQNLKYPPHPLPEGMV